MRTGVFYQIRINKEWVDRYLTVCFVNQDSYSFMFHQNDDVLLKLHTDLLSLRFPNEETKIKRIEVLVEPTFSLN